MVERVYVQMVYQHHNVLMVMSVFLRDPIRVFVQRVLSVGL